MKLKQRQKGSAAVEFVLITVALSPIFILTPMLAKTADANLASAQAARYGAWEQTVTVGGKDGDTLHDDLSNRFYTKPDASIRTNQGALTSEDQQNPMWGGVGLKGRLVDTAEDDAVSIAVMNPIDVEGVAAAAGDIVSTLGNALSLGGSDSEWGLGAEGIRTVSVALNASDETLIHEEGQGETCQNVVDNVTHCIRQKSAILTDTWGASGPGQVEKRVRSLVPMTVLRPVGDALSNIGVLPIFQELKKLDGIFGEVKPDVLPPDRYGDEEQ